MGGGVELPVGEVEPGGALVVEIGQRAFGQLGGALGILRRQPRIFYRADAFGIGFIDVPRPRAGA